MLEPVYYILAKSERAPPVMTTLGALALFLVASVGIAGFGHLFNDLFDVEQDVASGASNLVAGRSPLRLAGTFILVLLLAWVPWWWLPTPPAVWALLGLEFALFMLYSVPGVRLKERGILGPIADAIYSWTISTAVALLVFARLGEVAVPVWYSSLFAAWAFVLGLRHILTHQIEDAGRDQAAAMTTFVTRHGWMPTFRILERVLLPAEGLLFLAITLVIGSDIGVVPIGFLVWTGLVLARERDRGIEWPTGRRRDPAIHRLFFLNITLLQRFYTLWFPLLTLASLVARHPDYLLVAILHLLLFQNGLTVVFRTDLPDFLRRLRAAPPRGTA
jgi:4-hydroxybenzoate polyprenyltransferase